MNDVNAAMERVKRVNNGELRTLIYQINSFRDACECEGIDRRILSNAYLAERDDTAIDEAWLRSVCRKAFAHHVVFGPPEKLVTVWKSQMGDGWCIAINVSHPMRFETLARDQLRNLLTGLSIPTSDAGAK